MELDTIDKLIDLQTVDRTTKFVYVHLKVKKFEHKRNWCPKSK